MSKETVNVSRREFLFASTALGAGFSLGLYLPTAARAGVATTGSRHARHLFCVPQQVRALSLETGTSCSAS